MFLREVGIALIQFYFFSSQINKTIFKKVSGTIELDWMQGKQ